MKIQIVPSFKVAWLADVLAEGKNKTKQNQEMGVEESYKHQLWGFWDQMQK